MIFFFKDPFWGIIISFTTTILKIRVKFDKVSQDGQPSPRKPQGIPKTKMNINDFESS